MAHFDEMACLLYLDGQLESLRARELELHVRSCTPCRSLLAALERESNFLRTSVIEEYEPVPAHLLAPPQPDRVPWGWISLLGFSSAGLYYVLGIFDSYAGQFNQAGFSSIHVIGQALSNALFWKGWSDVMTALIVLSVAALALPAAWFVWKNIRRARPVAVVLAGLSMMLMLPAPAAATRIERGQAAYTIRADETVKEDLIVFASTLRIEGNVEGDVIAFCESVTITGNVKGDVIAFTRRLRINGKIDGDIRTGANQVDLDGEVTGSVTSFSEGFNLSEKGSIGRSLINFSAGSDIDGKVQRDVLSYTDKLRVNGAIAGEIRAHSQQARIGSDASVGGKLIISGRRQPEILNEALRSKLEFKLDEREGPDYTSARFYWRQMLRFGAAFFFGLALLLLMPGFYDSVQRQSKRYGPAMGVGLLALFATPILACLACITLVGFAIGISGLMLWVVTLYAAQVVVGAWIGARMLGEASEVPARIGRLATGLLVIRILGNVPEIGWVVWLIIFLWGMGAITLALFRSIRSGLEANPITPVAPLPSAPPATA